MAMRDQRGSAEIRDLSGRLLGTIRALSRGKLEARDGAAALTGTYDAKCDETRDARGYLVGTGNQLNRLLIARNAEVVG